MCAASGPSFTVEQAEIIERARAAGRCRVIAVNTTGLPPKPPCRPVGLPRADVLYAADTKWWTTHHAEARAHCAGEFWTASADPAQSFGLRHIVANKGDGLSPRLDQLHKGGNSGYQAIGLAYLFGARRIVLVGYDLQREGGQENGRKHHHGDHPEGLHNTAEAAYAKWIPRFTPLARDLAAAGCVVLNCSPGTALRCFPRASLDEVFAEATA